MSSTPRAETREFAFWHATMAASLKYGLAMACYIGYLPCRCRQFSPSFACQLNFGERWAAYFMAPPRIEGRFGDDLAYISSLRHNLAVGRHVSTLAIKLVFSRVAQICSRKVII